MPRIVTGAHSEPEGSPRASRLSERIHSAWELSQPQSFGTVLSEEPDELPVRWPERIQESVAAVFYFGTFFSIVTAVFFRFALNRPLIWSIELPTYLFFWCFCFATPLSDWEDDQISFDLLAERMPPRWRLVGNIVGNVLIVIPFLIVLPGTLSYLRFQGDQLSSGLPFNQVWGYAGILPFFVLAALLRGRLLIRQLRELSRSLHRDRRSGG